MSKVKQTLVYDISGFPHTDNMDFNDIIALYNKGIVLWDSNSEYLGDAKAIEPKVVNVEEGTVLEIIDMARLNDKQKKELIKKWKDK